MSYRKKNISLTWVLLALFCTISCGERKLSEEEIIDHYGAEVINYFYETVFHGDRGIGKLDKAHRWNSDILVSMHGDILEGDSLSVRKALSVINSLELGVSMRFADSEESNLKIYFGDAKTLEKQLNRDSIVTLGVGIVWDNSDAWYLGKIGILNGAPLYTQIDSISAIRLRETNISEEITQALGILGDSYTYYKSHFFEGFYDKEGGFEGLTEIDKQTIKLLYDKRVFEKHSISREEFEERFSAVLYNRIDVKKLQELAREYQLDRQDLDSLGKMVFRSETKDTFVKFPRDVFLKLSGDSTEAHRNFCKALAEKVNRTTPYLQIKVVKNNRLWNYNPAITIQFEENEKYRETINALTAVSTNELMFTYQVLGDIWLRFSDPIKEVIAYEQAIFLQNRALTRSLFKTMGLDLPGKVLINGDLDNLEIDKKYMDYFRFLYDPRFPSGISKVQFEKLLKEINYAKLK